ncbi:MAG: hypothetical protein KJP20_11055 [Bacteroidia bacterium]|nr:hypothetical protein [Bacteroidia bacterium]NNK61492.1 hypothetical protein [Flavobacteriaceae bacterium]
MKTILENVLSLIGLFLIAVYVINATEIISLPVEFVRIPMFLLGPIAIIGVTSLEKNYRPVKEFVQVQAVGYNFLIVTVAILTTMLVVQQAGSEIFDSLKENDKANVTFKLTNSVHKGMDIAFDIFYSLGILFFSLSFLKLKKLGFIIGLVGVASSLGLLVLNLITFPNSPKSAGLMDLGPITIIWWVLIFTYANRKKQA